MRRIFISATSDDLGSYRRAVRDVLLSKEILPLVQDHFSPDYRSVVELLEEKIRQCDAMVCLVGFVYGQEPRHRPADEPRRSYTQLEYVIARRLGKPVHLFLARENCPFDAQVEEAEELRQLQLAYRAELRQSDQMRSAFRSVADLQAQIGTISFPLPPNGDGQAAPRPNNLPYSSLGTLFKGRDAFLVTLRESLLAAPSHTAALVPKAAIHGLGGVGKTRLAAEYAWRHQAEYTALLFVLADTPANLRRNLAALTAPLILNLEEHQAQEEDVQVAAVLRWLQTYSGWLLILDNALLRLLAWLAPAPIPLLLFESEAASQIFAKAVAGRDGNTPASYADLEEVRTAPIKFSMARWEGDETLRGHRLVQELTRERLAEDAQRFGLEQALRLVDAALPAEPLPNDVRSWPVWEPLHPHVGFVVDQADRAGLSHPTSRLMNDLGLFLTTRCVFAEAEPLVRRAMAIDEAAYGATHPEVARGLNNLGGLLQDTNRLEEAEPLCRSALAIFCAAYGSQHPNTQTVAANYQRLLEMMGWSETRIEETLREVLCSDG